jgi:hypothetical protein
MKAFLPATYREVRSLNRTSDCADRYISILVLTQISL